MKQKAITLMILLGMCIFGLLSCSETEDGNSGQSWIHGLYDVPDPGPEKSELEKYIYQQMTAAPLAGLAVSVVRNNEIVYAQGFGWADIDNEIPVIPSTLFMLASVSKTLTVTALMHIWEQHLFELDENINPFLSFDVKNPRYPEEIITFRQLLTHISSIRDNWDVLDSVYTFGADSNIGLGQFMDAYFNPGGEYYDADANFYNYPPGTVHHYCNQAVTLSGYLVEVLSGTSFENYTQAHIFTPLEMTDTNWHLSGLDLNQVALPYGYSENQGFYTYGHFTYPDFPAGGLRSNVYELGNFLIMMLNNGNFRGKQIVQPETLEMIMTPQIPDINPDQALVWFIMEREGQIYYHHGGGDFGVRTYVIFRPSDNIGVVALSNTATATMDQVVAFNNITFRLFDEAYNF